MKKSGILLPIFSLPNNYGIGTLGRNAYKFIDYLKEAKQDYWQILPMGPTSFKDSPYQTFSSFAFNPYFIDLDVLVEEGLLTKDDLKYSYLENKTNHIDYGSLFKNKLFILKKSYFKSYLFEDDFNKFLKENKWASDYALFMVLKEKHNNKAWYQWDDLYKFKDEEAIKAFKIQYRIEIAQYAFMQYLFLKQWKKLKSYANENGVEIIGDLPIYVSYDSVDVWLNPELFKLDGNLNPTVVAGVPPDYFSSTGQLWGNPIYNYDVMELDNYKWWVSRINYQLSVYDVLRIDHFRAFSAYYEIPYGEKTAIKGEWQDGPKMKLFSRLNKKSKIIAENLGLLDDDVYKLIYECNYPGMRILEFEFYSQENINNLKKISHNNIIYPGTHDNDTFKGWLEKANKEEKALVEKELKIKNTNNLNKALINYCYSLKVDTIIISMQDVLNIGSEGRLNTPGTDAANWQYMFDNNIFNKNMQSFLANAKNKYKM